jgi:hypothetical protein
MGFMMTIGYFFKKMRSIFSIFFILSLCGLYLKAEAGTADKNINQDSVQIVNASLGFYNWYLNCLKHDSTYNSVQPNYHWQDKIPIIDVDVYLKKLKSLGFVSDFFIGSEWKRFQICQDSLNNINYKAAMDCGCSVGEFFSVCSFIDSFYWFSSQEKPDGCEVKKTEIAGNEATCQLKFFWNSNLPNEKNYDENFDCQLNLKKHKTHWLIESIKIKRH